MQSVEQQTHLPVDFEPEYAVAAAERVIDKELYAVNTLNQLATLTGFRNVSFYFHDNKEYCTDGEGKVGIPRQATSEESEQIDILDGLSHELCAHIFDMVYDPEYVQKLNTFTKKGKDPVENSLRFSMQNIFTDIVGNTWKARLLPRLGIDQREVYQRILIPDPDFRGKPRVSQVLNKLLRDAMVPGEEAIIDAEVQGAFGAIQTLLSGTLDRRTAANDTRFDIWTELVWPELNKLLDQDRLDHADDLSKSLQSMEAQHSAVCSPGASHLHEQQSVHEHPPTLADAMKQASTEADKLSKLVGAGRNAELEQLTGYDYESRKMYSKALQKYAPTLDELEEAFRLFLIQDKVVTKKHRTTDEGQEISADFLVSGYIASLSGEESPVMWDEIVRKESYKTRPAPFDLFIVSDATGSMASAGISAVAAEATALMSHAFERYNRLSQELLENCEDKDLSRMSVITFAGEANIEQPLSAFGTDKQHLDAFHHVRLAQGGNTLIHSGVDAVVDMHEEVVPPRRKLVVIFTDGDDGGMATTKKSIHTLHNLGYKVRVLNFSGSLKGFQGEELVASPVELPSIMFDIAKQLIDEEAA